MVIDNSSPRFVVFGTLEPLKMLCSAEHRFVDGTFKSSSSPFLQLWSIHIESSILNSTMPVIYSLLPDKFKMTYTKLFNEIRNACVRHNLVLNPELITVDFEQGCLNSLKNIFPNTTMKGCNFHFNKYIFKKITDLGWREQYYSSSNDDPKSIKALYQQTYALAFTPLSNIDDVWCAIMDNFDDIPDVNEFFDYVTDNWVDYDALYPQKLWNYYRFNGLRINNSIEGWHHKLNSSIASTNPNLYFVLDEMKEGYTFHMATLRQVQYQEKHHPRRKKFIN